MIQRRKAIARSTKPLKRTRIRCKRPTPRRGPLRCQPYKDWLREEGKCRACRIEAERLDPVRVDRIPLACWFRCQAGFVSGYCDPAHTENNGMSSKGPDSSCAPLCRGFGLPNHHAEYDAGREEFVAKYGYDPKDEAAAHWAAWLILQEGK